MRRTRVNVIEQYVEKIVLGAVVAVLAAVAALQFLHEPNRVEVANEKVPPGEAFRRVEAKARRVAEIMSRSDPSQLDELRERLRGVRLSLAEEFRARLTRPTVAGSSPAGRVALGPAPKFDADATSVSARAGTEPVADLRVPAPAAVRVATYRATVDPTEIVRTPALAAHLPQEQPFDTAWVTVEAVFNGAALREALLADPDGPGGIRPMPRAWWNESMAVLGLRVERQERAEDGTWGPVQEVPTPPGLPEVLSQAATASSSTELEGLAVEARAAEDALLRPPFYATIAGPAWVPPTEVPAWSNPAENPEVIRTLARITEWRRRLEALRSQLEAPGAPGRTPPTPRGPGGGGKGGGGATPPTRGDREPQPDPRRQALEREIARIEGDIEAAIRRLRELGVDEDGNPLPRERSPGSGVPARPLLDNPALRLWAHDITVQPGRTYRYRVQVGVVNPAFGRGHALVPQQQDMARTPVAWSAPSPWSEPVEVLAHQHAFITAAYEADLTSPPRATVEMYRFFYGYWRRGTAVVEPGDVLKAAVKLPEGTLLPIYDLAAMSAGHEGGGSPASGGPGPERPASPGKGGPAPGPSEPPRGAGASPGQPAPEPTTLPEHATPWTRPVIAAVDAVLLDVAPVAVVDSGERMAAYGGVGSTGPAATCAYLRVAGGRIEVRHPNVERASELRTRLESSAREGDRQGQPIIRRLPRPGPVAPPPARRGPEREPTPPPAGGGGGGGGAGGG